MTPGVLAALWGAAALAGAVGLRRLPRRRTVAALPLALAAVSALAVSVGSWPGLAASNVDGPGLALGRPGLGLIVAAAVALAGTAVLAPALEGGELPAACAVGGAAIVMLSATVPITWALATAAAVGVMVVRWITAAPSRATLAAGRIAGLGAAALLAGAALVPETVGRVDGRTTLAGALLAGGVGAVLGLVPVGGWAAAATTAVRGTDLGAWSLLLAPALLLSAGAGIGSLPTGTRDSTATDLLVLALVSAVVGGVMALQAAPGARYGREWIADLALATAGLACLHDSGRLGGMLLVLAHLVVGPLLLHAPRPGTERPHRVAWLAMAGLPPSPAFWGRLLVLQGLAQTSGPTLMIGLAAVALTTATAIRALVATDAPPEGNAAGRLTRSVAWSCCVAALVLGFAPGAIAAQVFGVQFS